MRESLRIMSLTPLSYGGSFLIFQTFFSILAGLIIGGWVYGNEGIFPEDAVNRSIQFTFVLIIFQIAQIPLLMSVSTMFSDAKVANYVGYIVVISPMLIFLYFVSIPETNYKYLIYLLFFMPQIPTCCMLTQLATSQSLQLPFKLVDLSWISVPVCWLAIILAIPLWLAFYIYLDQVMPNTYGVQRHPCFCLHKKRTS